MRLSKAALMAALFFLTSAMSAADEIVVAVASNFEKTAQSLIQQLPDAGDYRLVSGSTGSLYAQIARGLDAAVFIAGDSAHLLALEKAERLAPNSRVTYAYGKLALYSPLARLDEDTLWRRFKNGRFSKLVTANPKTSPYGFAAQQIIKRMDEEAQQKVVFAEDIATAFRLVNERTQNVGLVAYAHVVAHSERGAHIKLPANLYPKIEQQAAVLKGHGHNPKVRAFMRLLTSSKGKQRIRQAGFGLPK